MNFYVQLILLQHGLKWQAITVEKRLYTENEGLQMKAGHYCGGATFQFRVFSASWKWSSTVITDRYFQPWKCTEKSLLHSNEETLHWKWRPVITVEERLVFSAGKSLLHSDNRPLFPARKCTEKSLLHSNDWPDFKPCYDNKQISLPVT